MRYKYNSIGNPINSNLFHYAGNNPVRYVDPTGAWIDNEDGTYTAESGDTLWDLYGADWKEKSGYEGEPANLQVGDVVGEKIVFFEEYIIESNIQDPNYFVQGLIGGGEIVAGLLVDVGITFYVFGKETASLKLQGTLDTSVGTDALAGYSLGGLLMGDGFNMLISAFNKNKTDPIIISAFKDIFLSSPYQDVGTALQKYKEENDDK